MNFFQLFFLIQVVDILARYELNLKNCVCITRDNAPNIRLAFDLAEFSDVTNFPCACHSLNLVAGNIYNGFSITSAVVKEVDCLRMTFSNSRKRRELLNEKQKLLGLNQKVFPASTPTRWWSMHRVIDFFMANHKAIAECFSNSADFKQDEKFSYDVAFLSRIHTIHYLSSELYIYSCTMESDSEPTASLILPTLFNFSKRLASGENFEVATNAAKLCEVYLSTVNKTQVQLYVDQVFRIFETSFQDFKDKYLGCSYYETLAIATMLDPRYKSGKTFSATEKDRLIKKIEEVALEVLLLQKSELAVLNLASESFTANSTGEPVASTSQLISQTDKDSISVTSIDKNENLLDPDY